MGCAPLFALPTKLATNKELAGKVEELETNLGKHDDSIQEIVRLIKRLIEPPPTRRSKIGFSLPSARTRVIAVSLLNSNPPKR